VLVGSRGPSQAVTSMASQAGRSGSRRRRSTRRSGKRSHNLPFDRAHNFLSGAFGVSCGGPDFGKKRRALGVSATATVRVSWATRHRLTKPLWVNRLNTLLRVVRSTLVAVASSICDLKSLRSTAARTRVCVRVRPDFLIASSNKTSAIMVAGRMLRLPAVAGAYPLRRMMRRFGTCKQLMQLLRPVAITQV
jgi:hypothetical protein